MKRILALFIYLTLTSCGGTFDHLEVSASSNITVGLKGATGHTYEFIEIRGKHQILLDKTTGYYLAVNKKKYQTSVSVDDFLDSAEGDDYVTGLEKRVDQVPGVSGTELEVFYVGPQYSFELGEATNKDLEKLAVDIEKGEIEELKYDLVAKYGFSIEKSEKLGKLMNSYKKIKDKRALSGREKDVFTKELIGLSFDKASSVLVDEGYDALVEKASVVNGADPEAIKELLNEVL